MSVATQIHLNKFQLRPFQIAVVDALENKGYRRVLACWPRRAGKDLTAFNYCIRYLLKNVCVIYYIFPTYSQGRKILFDSITNSGQRILEYIPKEVIESINSQEMKIRFKNGSLFQVVGSDNYDSLVGTNPKGIVFSEYALQDPRAYQYLRPILAANDGWALFLSCVSPDTLVLGKNGFQRIKDVSMQRSEYSDLNQEFWGIGGFHNAEQFYYGGVQPTLKITLESGHQIECTPIHQLWSGNEWIKSQDLKVGDLLPIQYGQDVWGPGLDVSDCYYNTHAALKEIPFDLSSDDFFYFLGLLHADGNYDSNKVCITKKKDPEIIEFLRGYGFKTRPDGLHHEYSSRNLVVLLEYLGFKHGARNKVFPERLFACTKREMAQFLSGLFDGDGCSASGKNKYGKVKFTSSCSDFIYDLQVVLLNFGIVSSVRYEDREPQGRIKVHCRVYNLEITGYFAHIFYRDIGFRLERKQKNWTNVPSNVIQESGNVYPVDVKRLNGYSLPKWQVTNPERMTRRLIVELNRTRPHEYLQELLEEKFFYSPIKEITASESEVYDFVIPDTHSFFSNGYLSHNTPRGKNHFYELYQMAIHNPEWFVYKLTLDDTKHIPLIEIERERAEGIMSEDLIQQEYYTSFEMGVEGSYYAKYMDRMRLKGQIGMVPWEPAFKVHTAWDLGVRDSTCIIFFQTIGTTVRIIDCYDKNKEGLEHYVGVINSKPYSYGKHIAPHDIKVREFGTGFTRLEKARQLGITFIVAPDLSIMDGIEAVRSSLAKIWIDEKCVPLIKSLEGYRQEFDAKRRVYKQNPLHDQNSHYADSFRYLCITLPKTRDGMSAEEHERRLQTIAMGPNSNMPSVFRTDLPPY